MLKEEIYNYDRAQLIDWLRNEAGSSNPDYFHAKKTGGLKLQQVPEEYSELLLLLKNRPIKKYLCLGIGNGGSFTVECFFMQETLLRATAVDNLAYGALINQNREEVINYMQECSNLTGLKMFFAEKTTDAYFSEMNKSLKFDAIFIDADHSYEGAKRDYLNAMQQINEGGLIIFHDIASKACPGIMQLWNEVKQKGRISHEYIHGTNCGIGVIEI